MTRDLNIGKHRFCLVSMLLAFDLFIIFFPATARADFQPNPQNSYSAELIRLCDGQMWFMDFLESELNAQEKSINTVTSDRDLTNVTSIGLADRGLTGEIPPAIGKLVNLRYIYLSQNKLFGNLPDELYTLTKLENLDLSENEFSGVISSKIQNLANLRVLLLWGNSFSGEIPKEIGSLRELINLDLAKNRFDSEIPDEIGNLTSLRFLALSENELIGELPESLNNLTQLQILLAWGNQLTGEIPSLSALTEIEVLDLSDNELTGTIPDDVFSSTSLTKLSLADNLLEGGIHESVGVAVNLSVLDLAGNKLNKIPDSLSKLKNLTILDISNNDLRGKATDTLKPDIINKENLPLLQLLNVSGNILVGDVSDSLINLENNGCVVNISGNYLTGNNALLLARNDDNFIDGFEETQNRLMTQDYYALPFDTSLTVSDMLLWAVDAETGEHLTQDSLRLDPEDYTLEILKEQSPGVDPEWLLINTNTDGIQILSQMRRITKARAVKCRVYITANDASEYSEAIFAVYTKLPDEQGGGNAGIDSNMSYPASSLTIPGSKETTVNGNETPLGMASSKCYLYAYADGTILPDALMTREEFAHVIWELFHEYYETLGVNYTNVTKPFDDVETDRRSCKAIAFAKAIGVMSGYPDGSFRPDKPVSRAEIATILSLLLNLDSAEVTEGKFSDINGHWASKYIGAVYAKGIMVGYPDETFRPDKPVTRAEVAAVINRALGRNAAKNQNILNPFSDIDQRHWAYYEILEATRNE